MNLFGRHSSRRGIFLLLGATLVAFALLGAISSLGAWALLRSTQTELIVKPQSTQHIAQIGDLVVVFPPYYARSIEFENPGSADPVPGLAQARRLAGISAQIRYPDMAWPSSLDLQLDLSQRPIGSTNWMFMTLEAGSGYPGDGYLGRYLANLQAKGFLGTQSYSRQNDEFGLQRFLLIDEKTLQTSVWRSRFVELFVGRNSSGEVVAVIGCGLRESELISCGHKFSLAPLGVPAAVEVSYRHGQLMHWREIQSKVQEQLLGFVVR